MTPWVCERCGHVNDGVDRAMRDARTQALADVRREIVRAHQHDKLDCHAAFADLLARLEKLEQKAGS